MEEKQIQNDLWSDGVLLVFLSVPPTHRNYNSHKRLSTRFMTIAFIYKKIWFTNFTAARRRDENIKAFFSLVFPAKLYGEMIVKARNAAGNVAGSRKTHFVLSM